MATKGTEIPDVILDYMQGGLEQESKRTESLDSKSQFMISITSFLTGISFALISLAYKDLINPFQNAACLKLIAGIILVIADICFLIATICSIWSAAIRRYLANVVYSPDDIDQWTKLKSDQLMMDFAKQIQQTWLHNRSENDSKVLWLRRSTFWLSTGSLVLSIGILTVLGYLLIWSNI